MVANRQDSVGRHQCALRAVSVLSLVALAGAFRSGTAKDERRPAIEAYSQAARIAVYAAELGTELAELDPDNQRRMVKVMKQYGWDEAGKNGTPSRKRGRRCLRKVGSATQDL